MSEWTHVAGVIRVDSLEMILGGDTQGDLLKRFGSTVEFGDPDEAWKACSVPCGSEGSVQYAIQKTQKTLPTLAWGLITIWGDLRDYDDHHAIFDWLKKACNGLMVRSCSVKIDVEGHQSSWMIVDNGKSNLGMFAMTFGEDALQKQMDG